MPLINKRKAEQPASKKRIISSTRFDDSDEEDAIAVPANSSTMDSDDENDYDDDNEQQQQQHSTDDGHITSDEDISDDEHEDDDVDEDEDALLEKIEKMNITAANPSTDSNGAEKYYTELIRQAQVVQGKPLALDYDYQEADDDETISGVKKTKDNVAIYNPKNYQLADDEELDYSNEAYTMFHRMNAEWPCLSCDMIADHMGLHRTEFPMTAYMVAGSQASENSKNRLYVLKMSNLLKTENDSDSEDEDDEDDDNEFDDNDDEEDDDDENLEGSDASSNMKKQATSKNNTKINAQRNDNKKKRPSAIKKPAIQTKDPILEHLYIPLNTEVNRVRCMPQNNKIVALMCADATLRIFDVQSQFDLLNRDVNSVKSGKIPVTGQKTALQTLRDHKNEGFALDWSKVQQGRLGSGDFDANICVHNMQNDGTWKLLNNYKRHSKSVEDIQWSPSEANVFASCSCDGKVMIWDIRQPKKEGLSFEVSKTDVNVIAWNNLKQNHIATGDDNGIVTVWDMKAIATGGSQTIVAQYNYLEGEHVTSIQWHPTDEGILAVSTDSRVTIWDLSLETDVEAKNAVMKEEEMEAEEEEEEDLDIPGQLRFEHYGHNIKEVHWSMCLKDVLMCTGEMGMQIWKPSIDL